MRLTCGITCCGLLALLFPGHALTQSKPGIELKVVTYDALKKAVRDQRGKVVLVDFWGEF